jgi:hypothetical protein
MTNRELAIAGVGIGIAGILYEMFLSPKAQAARLSAVAAGAPLGPLGNRPLTSPYNALSPLAPAKMSVATPYTIGTPGPQASGGGGLNPNIGLSNLASAIGALAKKIGGGATPAPSSKGSAGGTGGQPSSASTGYAKSGTPGTSGNPDASGRNQNQQGPSYQTAGGPGPQGLTPYADENGMVAYPNGDGTYSDEDGNQVWIAADGTVTYDQTEDVGYVPGGTVFDDSGNAVGLSNALDPSDPMGSGLYLAPADPAAPDNQDPTSDQGDTTPPESVPMPADVSSVWAIPDDTALMADAALYDDSGDSGGVDTSYYDDNNADYSDF